MTFLTVGSGGGGQSFDRPDADETGPANPPASRPCTAMVCACAQALPYTPVSAPPHPDHAPPSIWYRTCMGPRPLSAGGFQLNRTAVWLASVCAADALPTGSNAVAEADDPASLLHTSFATQA